MKNKVKKAVKAVKHMDEKEDTKLIKKIIDKKIKAKKGKY